MANLISTFQDRFGDWVTALSQHLQLSLLTLLLAILLAVPLAVFFRYHEKMADWVLQIAGIFQTIPSLALLGLFIPVMGIGTLPALTALVIYAIFPILQNTITGLKGIDPSLQEAGIAFGMTTIFVTHDTDEALKLADRIAVLQDGEIRQVANPETILKAPATDFVADLFGGSVHG